MQFFQENKDFDVVAANEQVLPMVGELKNVRLANRSSLFIQRLKIYSDVQKNSFRLNQS
jgi:hypothetical protein